MKLKYIPLRIKLIIWYSAIVCVSILTFALYAYLWVSAELRANLDTSIIAVANSLVYLIEDNKSESADEKSTSTDNKNTSPNDEFSVFREDEKSRFVGPLRPSRPHKREDKGKVWTAIFEHMLMNPQNYYIQIADANGQIVWKSKNFKIDSLPLYPRYAKLKPWNKPLDSTFEDIVIQDNKMRLLIKKTQTATVSIAFTVEDIEDTLKDLFAAILLSLPLVLLASIFGGLWLSGVSLNAVDKITKTVKDITAKNLSLRLDVPPTNDEIGRLTETLNEMIERLEKSFAQIKQFTSDASHELRTPLTILRGEMELALHSDRTVEEYNGLIASSLDEVMRLTNMIEALLELSRGDVGQVKMKFGKGNISQLLLDICEDMEILSENKNITLTQKIEPDVIIEYDSHRIHQAIMNIMDNAIKYTPDDGNIKIELKKDKQNVEIIVSDSGMGIPESDLSKIFNRFYRVDKARSKDIQGTGLGLSIVKWIIDCHKGKIIVFSEVKKGTTFKIQLPLTQEEDV